MDIELAEEILAGLHEWEDVQLRATKDGMYVASGDYCSVCGTLTINGVRLKVIPFPHGHEYPDNPSPAPRS